MGGVLVVLEGVRVRWMDGRYACWVWNVEVVACLVVSGCGLFVDKFRGGRSEGKR